MCTAITYKTKNSYFGRNLDLEYSYQESVTITPRKYPFKMRNGEVINDHYALMGMAYVVDNYPLYYDAMNEKGLAMAGLNFPGNAYYHEINNTKINVAPFEFIPYILTKCTNVKEAKELLAKINLANINYSDNLPASPLHWLIADKDASIVVESVQDGLKIYDNPVGILTNNPTFDMQLFNLNNYMHLSKETPVNNFAKELNLTTYSRGMGALGLPGDLSSQSRFVKAAFTKMNSLSKEDELSSINQFFHILESVYQQRGCVHMGNNEYEITIYSSCCNLEEGIYYYKTYDNSEITGLNMYHEDLESNTLKSYPLIKEGKINMQN